MGETANKWHVVAASVAGVSHVRSGLPCQDAHAYACLPGGELIAAAADGAGSATCAEIGAEIAASVALNYLRRQMEAGSRQDIRDAKLLGEAALQALSALQTEAQKRNVELRELATTLLLVVAREAGVAALQIGDGAVVAQRGDGKLVALTTPPESEYANTTTFLTSPDALETAQIYTSATPVTHLALFTDGLQRLALRLPDGEPHAPFFAPLFRFLETHFSPEDAASQLTAFLQSPRLADRTDDDLTLLLALRVQEPGESARGDEAAN